MSIVTVKDMTGPSEGSISPSIQKGGSSQPDYVEIGIVLALCCLFAYLRWLKMDSLVWLDPARWLFESWRVANGEIPYRDFSWPYPPFSVLLFGYAMKWFGMQFAVAQILIEIISIAVVLLAYTLLRLLLPRPFRLAAILLFVTVCATTQTKFNLFSFSTYVPALETGAAGCLSVLIGIVLYLRGGVLRASSAAAIVVGSFVAAYSKPESLVGAWTALVLLAVVDRHFWFEARSTGDWVRHYSVLLVACAIPALLAYAWIAAVAGPKNLIAGVTGYGLAFEACPWWPTGVGVFGAFAALGQAAALAGALALTRRQYFAAKFGRTYKTTQALSLIGMTLYVAYFMYLNLELFVDNRSWTDRWKYSLPTTLWTNAILIPVMWVSICWCVYLLLRIVVKQRLRERDGKTLETLILLAVPVVMSIRGLFNTTLDKVTEVSAICYPFFLILAPYLVWRLIKAQWPEEDISNLAHSWAARGVVALLVGYSLIRVAGAYNSFLSDKNYTTLSTLAGDIRLRDYNVDAEIYKFVMSNTRATDTVLDIPYGGGINVASGRKSPAFTTQFVQFRMPAKYMQEDLDRIRQHPPKVVIVQDDANYGASYGLHGSTCTFPGIVWNPPLGRWEPDKKFPAIEYIRQNYRVAEKVGPKLLLVPK